MVSEKSQQLFLEAVDALGAGPTSFSSLDDFMGSFSLPYKKALLHDRFIRASVWNLSKESPWSDDYKRFLLQVKPEASTRYLVGALANPACVDAVKFVLLSYGASRDTVNPLVGALADPGRVDAATGILVSYGQEALQFIHEPISGTHRYKQITMVISMINAKAA